MKKRKTTNQRKKETMAERKKLRKLMFFLRTVGMSKMAAALRPRNWNKPRVKN